MNESRLFFLLERMIQKNTEQNMIIIVLLGVIAFELSVIIDKL